MEVEVKMHLVNHAVWFSSFVDYSHIVSIYEIEENIYLSSQYISIIILYITVLYMVESVATGQHSIDKESMQ